MSAYLDTHVALWLYAGETQRVSKRAAAAINREPLALSPVVLLEMQYLREIGRITVAPKVVVTDLGRRLGLAVEDRATLPLIEQALDLSWTRDAFDRLIVAQAALDNAWLITRDRLILKHYPKAVW
jgi:PIN domain nuclease of toxin-antitoxin system